MEWDLAIKFFLPAMQLRAFCETISQHGDGNCDGKGKSFEIKTRFLFDIGPLWFYSMTLSLMIFIYLGMPELCWLQGKLLVSFPWMNSCVYFSVGSWCGLDYSSWHWWVASPGWCRRVFPETFAGWRWEGCWYGDLPQLCECLKTFLLNNSPILCFHACAHCISKLIQESAIERDDISDPFSEVNNSQQNLFLRK